MPCGIPSCTFCSVGILSRSTDKLFLLITLTITITFTITITIISDSDSRLSMYTHTTLHGHSVWGQQLDSWCKCKLVLTRIYSQNYSFCTQEEVNGLGNSLFVCPIFLVLNFKIKSDVAHLWYRKGIVISIENI